MSIAGVVFTVLLVLKMLGLIHCSWLLVFAPLFIGAIIWLLIITFASVFVWWKER